MGCNCNETPTPCNQNPCTPPVDCSCPVKDLSTDCSTYTGDDLACSGIKKGTILTNLIQQLDAFICDLRDELIRMFTIVNIGSGARWFKGTDALARKVFRTAVSTSPIITIQEASNDNEVEFGIDEDELNDFIEANQKTYSIENIGGGIGLYSIPDDVVGDNTEFNFRSLTSSGGSVLITQELDSINLEVDIEPAINCLTSTDKTVAVTEVEGCFDLSVNLPTLVNVGTGEDVYKTFNSLTNQNEFKTLKSNNSTISLSPSIDELSLDVNNLQKTINAFPYTLTSSDDKYTIFVTNGLSDVVINVPDGLVDNFSCVFIQEGAGSVTIQQSGTATLLYPSTSLQNIIKGIYYWAMIEKKLSTNTYYLLGSLLPV